MLAFESRENIFTSASHLRRRVLVAAVALAAATTTREASADHPAETAVDPKVKQLFDQGNGLFRDGRYVDALVAYDKAYSLSHNYKILYNRAQCLDLLKREPEAIDSFTTYLADGGAEIPADRRASVEASIASLKARLGTIKVVGLPDGAEVLLDGRVVAKTPLTAPISAGMGVHDLSARAPGATAVSTQISVVAGEETTQALTLNSIDTSLTTPVAPRAEPTDTYRREPDDPTRDSFIAAPRPPPRPAGGLPSPALTLGLELGYGVPASPAYFELASFQLAVVGLSLGYRISPLWEIDAFFSRASANGVNGSGNAAAVVGLTADMYALEFGAAVKMHIAREAWYDLSAELGIGGYAENWTTLPGGATSSAGAFLLKFGLGFDVPVSHAFALGAFGRYHWTGTSYPGGLAGACATGQTCTLNDTTNGFFEAGIRVTWSLGFTAVKSATSSSPITPGTTPAFTGPVARDTLRDVVRF